MCHIFEHLFTSPQLLARHRNGPVVEDRLAYIRHRADQGMARGTLIEDATYLLLIAERLRLGERVGETIRVAELQSAAICWARSSPRKIHPARTAFLFKAIRWLGFLGHLEKSGSPPRAHADLIAAYADSMRNERGLSPVTIDKRCWCVQHFLDRPDIPQGALKQITIADIDAAFVAMATAGGYARSTLNTRACGLRSFFFYAERRGWCCLGLAAAIHVPRVYVQESLPLGPSWDHVQRLLQTAAGDRPADVRESAMLMLFAFYGLRAREVGQLRLEHIDWEGERLLIANDKAGRTRTYPLIRPVGDAVLRYLKEARPRSLHREVFLTLRAPFRPLSGCGLWNIVAKRLRSLGVALSEYGPRSLRHACATHLLNAGGLSMKEVGDHLGHRDPDSTQIYAKVNLTGLRKIADLDLGALICNCKP